METSSMINTLQRFQRSTAAAVFIILLIMRAWSISVMPSPAKLWMVWPPMLIA
eukprot:CAMPEP_0184990882 /NCGR_PEP_ID=MMETSP1098-20130426/34375_1 /TAXON_ID=89044 /ORGANISM="Spumella elongata, Strain CCAP 955/1" /LENGTH=52 /DNA_ID=CAMNT_0027516177 /DNA_START=20 /DNA_END=174 /DNA_ORIENTATION=-